MTSLRGRFELCVWPAVLALVSWGCVAQRDKARRRLSRLAAGLALVPLLGTAAEATEAKQVFPPDGASLRARLALRELAPVPQFHAVLINSDTVDRLGRHKANVQEAYAALKAKGIAEECLIVLAPWPLRPESAQTNHLVVDGSPTRDSFMAVMDHLIRTGREGAIVFLYVTGEGRRSGEETFWHLTDFDLSVRDLIQNFLGRFKKGTLHVVVMDGCHTGLFLDRFKTSGLDYIAVANNRGGIVKCRQFAKAFWAAFGREGVSVRRAYDSVLASLSREDKERDILEPQFASSGAKADLSESEMRDASKRFERVEPRSAASSEPSLR